MEFANLLKPWQQIWHTDRFGKEVLHPKILKRTFRAILNAMCEWAWAFAVVAVDSREREGGSLG